MSAFYQSVLIRGLINYFGAQQSLCSQYCLFDENCEVFSDIAHTPKHVTMTLSLRRDLFTERTHSCVIRLRFTQDPRVGWRRQFSLQEVWNLVGKVLVVSAASFDDRNVWLFCVHGSRKNIRPFDYTSCQSKWGQSKFGATDFCTRWSCMIRLKVCHYFSVILFSEVSDKKWAMSGAARCGRLVWGHTVRARGAGK